MQGLGRCDDNNLKQIFFSDEMLKYWWFYSTIPEVQHAEGLAILKNKNKKHPFLNALRGKMHIIDAVDYIRI